MTVNPLQEKRTYNDTVVDEEGPTLTKKGKGGEKVQSSILSHFSRVAKEGIQSSSSPLKSGIIRETTSSSNLESHPTTTTSTPNSLDTTQSLSPPPNYSNNLTPDEQALLSLELNQLPEDWLKHLKGELCKPSFKSLKAFLSEEERRGMKIFPPEELRYSWAKLCPFEGIRVVLIGQDPYHNDRQAMGLCFSVPKGVATPPSLINIYKELGQDIAGFKAPNHGDLTKWAEQGVLLLNTSLSVRAHEPASHSGKGWEQFTDAVIKLINQNRKNVVFILWGNHAQKKAPMIDKKKHLVLTGVHPSPLSASRGFFGCKHFSKTNEYLTSKGLPTIDWQLPM